MVVVGAGFNGLSATRVPRRAPVQITVIDARNHHLFRPMVSQMAGAKQSPANPRYTHSPSLASPMQYLRALGLGEGAMWQATEFFNPQS